MNPTLATGVAAALLSALLGVGWQLVSRHGVTTTLGPLEIASFRYGVPALVLLPVWYRAGWRPRGMGWGQLALFLLGGLPFGLLVLAGAQFAPAAHIGVFMAGTIPVFTALVAWAALSETVSPARAFGLAVILAGVALLGLSGTQPEGSWRGDLLFLLAALAWAVHTVVFRGSGLTPWQGVAVVNGWSTVGVLLLAPFLGLSKLATAPAADILLQFTWQGLLSGLVGLVAYMAAVARLGSARAALSTALVPALTATGAAWLLGEPLGAGTAGAAALVGVGVVLASGVGLGMLRTAPARGRGSA